VGTARKATHCLTAGHDAPIDLAATYQF
jgi:hypothetical protein